MCLLFVACNPDPPPGGYRLVLANVRDEFYYRPTKLCAPWDENPSVYGARDQEKGREGGTWLAINKNGKIGVLLNILQPSDEILPDKKGRGFLVPDYVQGCQDGAAYLEGVCQMASDYNGFLMVALEVSPVGHDVHLSYYTNVSSVSPYSTSVTGVHAFGNSPPPTPWPKVTCGKDKFDQIVSRHPDVTTKAELIQDLLQLLTDRTEFPLDDQMRAQGRGRPEEDLKKLTAIYVEIPKIKYGSRTHSLILIDKNNQVDFVEKTMKEPVTCLENVEWIMNTHTFSLDMPTP